MEQGFGAALAMFGLFGGTSLIIWTSVQAKIARIKAEAQARQQSTPLPRRQRHPGGDESDAAADGANAEHEPRL